MGVVCKAMLVVVTYVVTRVPAVVVCEAGGRGGTRGATKAIRMGRFQVTSLGHVFPPIVSCSL